MSGYSGTPLPRKLGIREDSRVALLAAPAGFLQTLGDLPPAVSVRNHARGRLDVIVLFSTSIAQLERRFGAASRATDAAGGLWVAWPKRSSGVDTDLDENVIREIGLESGMVDNKVCAIDETWSGLRFVYRLKDRPPR